MCRHAKQCSDCSSLLLSCLKLHCLVERNGLMLLQSGQKACLQLAGGYDVRESGESGWLWRECVSSVFHISLFAIPVKWTSRVMKRSRCFLALRCCTRRRCKQRERRPPVLSLWVVGIWWLACGFCGKPSWSLVTHGLVQPGKWLQEGQDGAHGESCGWRRAEACPHSTQSCCDHPAVGC